MSARQVRASAVIAALDSSYRRFRGVVDSMSPNPIEVQLAESGDKDAYWNDLRYRLSDIHADLHIALEQLLAAVLHLTAVPIMREAHDLIVLFEALPPAVQGTCSPVVGCRSEMGGTVAFRRLVRRCRRAVRRTEYDTAPGVDHDRRGGLHHPSGDRVRGWGGGLRRGA